MAKKEMSLLKHPYVGTEHLLLAILNNDNLEVTKILNKYNITYGLFKDEIIRVIGIGTKSNEWYLFTPLLKQVLEDSILACSKKDKVKVEDIFVALIDNGEGVANRILIGMNIDIDCLYEKFVSKFNYNKHYSNDNLLIDKLGINYNREAENDKFDEVIGRDKEINILVESLLLKNKNNPLLIGDAGVGKTAIVEELARRISKGDIPERLSNMVIYGISTSSLVSGTKYRGEFEERFNKLITELEDNENIILFIDEIHTIVGAGGAEGAIDASNILKPYIARGKIKIIGATTKDEYHKFIEKDKALDRRFKKIYIEEPSLEATKNILKKIKKNYEEFHSVSISDEIIDNIVELSNKYIIGNKQPDKAIDLLDELCSKTSLKENKEDVYFYDLKRKLNLITEKKKNEIIKHNYEEATKLRDSEFKIRKEIDDNLFLHSNKKNEVKLDYLYEVISEKSLVPLNEFYSSNESIYKKLKNCIFGQDKNISDILNFINKRHQREKNVPLILLLYGNKGVGKTFFVEEYAKALYPKDAIIRIDMINYMDNTSINRLIGSAPGYVGYDSGGAILNKIKDYPYSLILLENINVGNSDVVRLFLKSYETGYIEMATGERLNVSNTIIFMTLTTDNNLQKVGFSNEKENSIKLDSILGKDIYPRLPFSAYFNPLDEKIIKKIIKKKLIHENIDSDSIEVKVESIKDNCEFLKYGAKKIDELIQEEVVTN